MKFQTIIIIIIAEIRTWDRSRPRRLPMCNIRIVIEISNWRQPNLSNCRAGRHYGVTETPATCHSSVT